MALATSSALLVCERPAAATGRGHAGSSDHATAAAGARDGANPREIEKSEQRRGEVTFPLVARRRECGAPSPPRVHRHRGRSAAGGIVRLCGSAWEPCMAAGKESAGAPAPVGPAKASPRRRFEPRPPMPAPWHRGCYGRCRGEAVCASCGSFPAARAVASNGRPACSERPDRRGSECCGREPLLRVERGR
jgi:hypothetical protein